MDGQQNINQDNIGTGSTPDTGNQHTGKKRSPLLFGAIIAGVLVVIGGLMFAFLHTSKPSPTNTAKKEVNALTVYSWWTSGSEAAALSKLTDVYTKQYPNTALVTAPVSGGAGTKMLPIIKSLVAGGEAPDAFQLHAGYEVQPFFDAGVLNQIDYIWKEEGLKQVVPSTVQDMMQFNGHFYGVPVDLHRSNLIWYNKSVLTAHGIDPATLTSWDALFKASDKLAAAGIASPIQMGEDWTAAQVFETIVASEGIDFYQNFVNGKVTSPTDPKLIDSLNTFKKYLKYVNADHKTLQWDAGIQRIIKGTSAFSLMGDWANGEFKLVGMKYGEDYGSIPAPGTANMYGLVIDTFQHPKNTIHPTNSDNWLKVVVSKAGQDAFNSTKGSISVRNDSDVNLYDVYQKSAIADFKSVPYLYPSVAHGSGAPENFKTALNNIVTDFSDNMDVPKAANAITSATTTNSADYKKVWSLSKRD